MPAPRKRLTGALALATVASGLLLIPAAPAQASVSTKISSFPYSQNWSGLTATSTWGDFQGVEGFTAGTTIAAANQPNTTDVGTLTAEGTLASSLVVRTGTAAPNTDSNGGVLAYPNISNKTVALSATGTLTTPMLMLHLDTTGKSGFTVAYDVQDLDSSADDQPTRVALQYRVGATGAFTNVPSAYVADATVAGNTTVPSTAVSATLPAAVDNKADVYLRVMTLDNATGSNEHVGIDNISITAGGEGEPPAPLEATSPGNKSGMVGIGLTSFTLQSTGGTPPVTWTGTGFPNGVSVSNDGVVSGTPTESGTFTVTATAHDNAAVTDDVTFDLVVAPAPAVKPISEVQGTGARSPFAPPSGNGNGSEVVSVEGVVTARYATGGFNGMYIQDPGADTEGASDGIFVYAGSSNANIPAGIDLGDSVRVTGPVAEFFDLTQIVPASAGAVVELGSSLGTVEPRAITYPTTDAAREAREGELLAPTGDFTVSNNYSLNQYGEIGLAAGTTPLRQWTEYASPHDLDGINAIKADNASRAVTLDDAQTTNFLGSNANKAIPLPWLTPDNGVRVGAAVTFTGPLVLDWRNNVWKFQPTLPVTDDGSDVATFEDTRADNLVPAGVGGDLKIATFNVLNYFNTTGEAYVAAGPQQNPPIVTHCAYYNDRQSNPIGNDQCGVKQPGETYTSSNPNDGRGPRGAATAASLARQEQKLTHTLIALDADIIGLEEVENSIKLPGETNRDDAVARIVQLLNASAGPGTWAYVKSPGEAMTAAAVAEQDVIRPAFIYQVEKVKPVGQSDILFGTTQFANAREPLAQAFKAKGAPDSDAFGIIVNHFKSKGDNGNGVPPATGDNANDSVTGVGAFNGDRVRQAQRLVEFADDFAEDRGIEALFLAGDFNAYTMEDPITTLEAGGYELIDSDDPNDESYSYQGLSGSLDHVLGNEAAQAMVTGADIWEINADESPAFQYSRFNYNVTNFFNPALPFGTSDHNPEIVGIDVPDFSDTTYREIQVLGTNDFHGRLLPDAGNAAGAAPFATAVKELKTEVPDSIFVAAGDLIGASTFESFIQDDEPTIEALNAMDLEVSAAGNHEFDQGYDDLLGRVQDLAQWEYIAANVHGPEGGPQLAPTFTKTFGDVEVGFVGAVTEDLLSLVNPAGMDGVTVDDVVESVNDSAADLKEDGADIVVLLVHEGSPTTECSSSSFTDPATTWGNIVQNTSSDVDAIISGHTHLAYNCRFPVADWSTRAVTKRPVVSAGQYGTNLNQLVFKLDETTGELAAISQDVIATAGVGYAPDTEVQAIVDEAVDFAETAGAQVLGKMDGPFKRAQYSSTSGVIENRGGESTLGNQVAEVQRWATDQAGIDTDVAFMNPGGLRADMLGTPNAALRDLTYRDAADVQPFANTLVNMKLTGAQIETVLEQQWQRNAQGGVPSRPFLRLGVSDGFTYTYVETPETVSVPNSAPVNTFKGEVTGMWLDGEPIDPAATYGVTVNSFLGTGGDNFWELANGTDKVDSGQVDLQAMVDYMAQYGTDPLAVDYRQRAVEVKFPNDAPEEYGVGDTISLDVASWAMTAENDVTDSQILLQLDGETIGTSGAVDNARASTPYDNAGKAHIEGTIPAGIEAGETTLTLVGNNTGTEIPVVVTLDDGVEDIQILATNDFHGRLARNASGAEAGAAVLSGAVKQLREANPDTVFAAAGDLIGASTFESFIQDDKPTIDALNEAGLDVSAVGNHEFDKGYDDLVNRVMAAYDAEDNPRGGAEWAYIGANVRMKTDHSPALEPSWVRDFGDVEVGFVGAVTEDLPSLVSPDGIADIEVTDIVTEANAEAEALKADGVDIVVLLVHEGAATTALSSATDDSAFGQIVNGVNGDIDAIVSGHTHLAYNHAIPVPEWESEDRAVTTRPVVSAGQYGYNLNQLEFAYDTTSGEVVGLEQRIVALQSCTAGCATSSQTWSPNFPADPAVTSIVNAANAEAETLGAQVLGQIEGPFNRSKLSNGNENRGGESTLGNLVAEVQRWATESDEAGNAEIAFMNPGGLRQDMTGVGTGAFPRDLTYKQAAVVQPFANTLVNMDLTGANIKLALEQQWQRDGNNNVPSRPFLRLGASEGFTYTFDASRPEGSRITGMWLDGEPIDLAETYSVTVNSFLASGGDNFRAFNNGTNKRDTGKVDLEAMVDYMDEFSPVAVDASQRAVGVTFPNDAPESYEPGGDVEFALSSLAMAGTGNPQDSEVEILIGDEEIGTAPVDNTNGTEVFDNYGRADVDVTLPEDLEDGPVTLTVRGVTTGTEVPVTVDVLETIEDIQILATNDFHGRLARNPSGAEAGAAVLSGAVKELRGENPNTVFAAAGDLIGASTFESFIQDDKPTIDALNEAGLDVSSVGNHEFDKGYDDLVNRVMAEYDAEDNPRGGAEWHYIGANVRLRSNDSQAIPASWIKDFGDVEVGFVGAVTEDLPSLVSPDGIEDIYVTDIVEEANAEAEDLKEEGADIVVLLVHEGAATTALSSATDDSAFGDIVNGVDGDIDAIVSGHTHLAYNHAIPVQEWIDEGRAVTTRPVVSAGQYGYNLNQLEFAYDTVEGEVVGLEQRIVALQSCTAGCATSSQTWSPNFDADPAVTTIVNQANAVAETLGAEVLGQIEGPFNRSKLSNGNENRGGESTLGNLVAEVQRWATESDEAGNAQIAFMNPGGLRQDMTGVGTGAFPRDLTYKQAAVVQPFANTLVNMDLTGANIKLALEQQWQRDGNNNVPSRPFLRLGASEGFTYTFDASRPEGSRITGMWLYGEPIGMSETYSVTVNSFLASGGDNFRAFTNGTNKRDTGKVDLEAMVDYMDEFSPVAVDASQRAVGVTFPNDAPATYAKGATVRFSLSSLAMAGTGNPQDSEVEILIGDEVIGTAPVDNTNGTEVFDNYGRAEVQVTLPNDVANGPLELTVRGVTTGTVATVPITVFTTPPGPGTTPTTTSASASPMTWGTDGTVNVTVTPTTASGAVTVTNGGLQVGSGSVTNGTGTATIDGKALEPGTHTLTVRYAGNATHDPSQTTVTVEVSKATTTLNASAGPVESGNDATVSVSATPGTAAGAVTVTEGGATVGSGTLVDGAASITVSGLAPGSHALTVQYAGDAHHTAATTTVTVVVSKAASTTSASVSPATIEVGDRARVAVTVSADGVTPTGRVVAVVNGEQVDSATLSDGRATLRVGPFGRPGTKTVQIRYAGDDQVAASSTSVSVEVEKATVDLSVSHSPRKVKVDRTKVKLSVDLGTRGFNAGGSVSIRLGGQPNQEASVNDNGKVSFRLQAFGTTGTKTITVVYSGDDRAKGATATYTIDVVRR